MSKPWARKRQTSALHIPLRPSESQLKPQHRYPIHTVPPEMRFFHVSGLFLGLGTPERREPGLCQVAVPAGRGQALGSSLSGGAQGSGCWLRASVPSPQADLALLLPALRPLRPHRPRGSPNTPWLPPLHLQSPLPGAMPTPHTLLPTLASCYPISLQRSPPQRIALGLLHHSSCFISCGALIPL